MSSRTRCTPELRKERILVALPEPVTAMGLTTLINGSQRLQTCGEAFTATEARRLSELHKPDGIVVDPELEGGGTILLRDLARWSPGTRMVVFTGVTDPLSIQRSLEAGALGYVTRQDQTSDLLTTILCALEGKRHLSPRIEHVVLEQMARGGFSMRDVDEAALSDRELQVFRLIGVGKALREVAAELHVSTKTIETHRHRIKMKLQLRNCADLQRRAMMFYR